MRHQQGQGLLELLIAAGIIMVSVVTTMTLVLATGNTSDVSKTQILAANLAREGVEVVRGIRDSNWLKIDSGILSGNEWTQNLENGLDHEGIATFIPPSELNGGIWQLSFGIDDITDEYAKVYFHPVTGIYTQFPGLGSVLPDFVPTNYSRLITINPVCWDFDEPGGMDPQDTEIVVSDDCSMIPIGSEWHHVGYEVTSRVRWLEKGRPHTIEVIDKLFNWKL